MRTLTSLSRSLSKFTADSTHFPGRSMKQNVVNFVQTYVYYVLDTAFNDPTDAILLFLEMQRPRLRKVKNLIKITHIKSSAA